MDFPYRVFGEGIDDGALDQFYSAVELPYVVAAALMPDAHRGYTLPIGAVVATDNMVMPSWVGYDIGCGMLAVPTSYGELDVLDKAYQIYANILNQVPVGFKHNRRPLLPTHDLARPTETGESIFDTKGGYQQLGTLGGGNHFIEIGYGWDRQVWLVIHSGSRGIGHGIASHYMRKASPDDKLREGHYGFEADSPDGLDYQQDQEFCLQFALQNRLAIARRVENAISSCIGGRMDFDNLINRNHNHVEKRGNLWIHRKGATHAEDGMMGVVPGNMRDGTYIVRGKGHAPALWSSSHGAGRVMGRKEAKRRVDVEDFRRTMDGITAKVGASTVDESPFAYKDIHSVMEHQTAMVDIIDHITPLINVKG